jgi:carnitine O-acetyltransferase
LQNRERLLALKNRPTLDNIESSLFALSLDTHTLESQPTSDPLIRPSLDAHVQNCASGHAGRNRWFDKALSIVIETDGRAGMMGEHSPCDALIPSVIVDYVVAEPVDTSRFDAQPSRTDGWKRLEWNVDEELQTEIQQCEERNWKIVEDSDASQLWWSEYGADWIKKIGEC